MLLLRIDAMTSRRRMYGLAWAAIVTPWLIPVIQRWLPVITSVIQASKKPNERPMQTFRRIFGGLG